MKSSSARKASISLPAGLARELERIAKDEHRSLSGVLQEAGRLYVNTRRFEALQREVGVAAAKVGARSEDDVEALVHALRRERA